MAMIARDAGADTFMYLFQLPRFDWTKTLVLRGVAGDDLPYVFGTVRTQSDALAEAMQTYWTNFAKYANPNGSAASVAAPRLSLWPSFSSSDHGTRMTLLPPPPSLPTQPNYGAADCEFWRTKYEQIFASGHKYSHR